MLRLRIDSLAKGGEAVARAEDGRVVFIDGGAPGDLVEVELSEQKPRYLRGRVARVIEAGPARVEPPCGYALRCGGCPWQIVDEAAQRAAKQDIVERALGRLGVVVEPLRAAPASLGYRGRATMYARGGAIGFYGRRSHALVPIERCIALEPGLDEAMQRARTIPDLGRALGEEGALRGTIVPAGQVQLALEPGRGADRARLATIAARLVEEGVAAGVLVEGRAHGADLLDAGAPGRPFWVSAEGFRQANEAQNLVLRRLVDELLAVEGQSLVELYAGDGNFTRDQIDRAARITAIEEDAAAIARLRRSLPGVEAIAGRAERELERLVARGARYTRLLLDPPRAGAKEAVPALLAAAPERIVYVSCDPATLARDLGELARAYTIERVVPVDLMPHTDHVEVVASLRRQ